MGRGFTCPSSRPEQHASQVIGIVDGVDGGRQVEFLAEPVPVTAAIREARGPVELTEMLRFASPCAKRGCAHFANDICGVARLVRDTRVPVVAELPACSIRGTCRWFFQEGVEACLRCPGVVTDTVVPVEREP